MKKSLVLLVSALAFVVAGCVSRPEKTVPSVLLTETQMVDVMTDVQIMESAISYKKSAGGQTSYLKTRGFDTIFAHYGINDSIFRENYDYYIEDMDAMQRILDSVVVRLNALK